MYILLFFFRSSVCSVVSFITLSSPIYFLHTVSIFTFIHFFLFCFFIFLDIPFMLTIISFGHIHNSNVNAPYTYIHFWCSYSSTLSHIHTFTITAPYHTTPSSPLWQFWILCVLFFSYTFYFFRERKTVF